MFRVPLTLKQVSVPYEITLLSNIIYDEYGGFFVSVPYEITLLSNACNRRSCADEFQYLMKLHYSQTWKGKLIQLTGFSTL